MRSNAPMSIEFERRLTVSRHRLPSFDFLGPASRRNARELPERLVERRGRKSRPALAGRNVMHQPRSGGKLCTASDRQMIGNSGAATELNAVAERHRTGQPDFSGDHAAAADADIVGDLHEVVDLGALADDRVGHGAAIDGGVGADLDVVLDDDAADLRQPLGRTRPGDETEPLAPDLGAAENEHPVADQRALDAGAGPDIAVPSDLRRRRRSPHWRQ